MSLTRCKAPSFPHPSMRSLFALLILLLGAAPALAQQENDDPRLPDIAPREVEIRGKLDITLPALQRPALTGLLSPTRLQPLLPLPTPAVETVEPPASTPQALLGGEETTASDFTELPSPRTGLIEAGAGRYLSRFGRARLNLPLARRWAFRSRIDYTGTDGFQPFDAENVETPSDNLRGAVTLRTERPSFNASLTADGFLGRHQLYGAERASMTVEEHPGRDRFGGGAAVHFQTGGVASLEGRARYDAAQVQTDVSGDGSDPLKRSEQRFRGTLQAGAPLSGLRAEADVQGSTARLSATNVSGDNTAFSETTVSFLDGGAGVWLRQQGAYRVFAGARVLTFSSEGANGTYVAPDVRLEWQAAAPLALYARTDPGAEANLLGDRYRTNPSLLFEEAPQPNLFTLDAEGGLRLFPTRALELRAFAGYRRAPSFLFYEDVRAQTDAPYTRGVTTARYGDARIFRAGGALSFRHAERLHASLSVTYRDGRLEAGDAEIPYFSPVVAEALFAYGFLDGKGRLQLTGTFESARTLTRSGSAEIDAFADLDVEGRYALTPAVGLVVRLHNLTAGALERYDRYPHPPLIVESGLRINL